MEVYVAERGYDYEGTTILGVFSSKEDARHVCDNDIRTYPSGKVSPKGDFYVVTKYAVDVPIND